MDAPVCPPPPTSLRLGARLRRAGAVHLSVVSQVDSSLCARSSRAGTGWCTHHALRTPRPGRDDARRGTLPEAGSELCWSCSWWPAKALTRSARAPRSRRRASREASLEQPMMTWSMTRCCTGLSSTHPAAYHTLERHGLPNRAHAAACYVRPAAKHTSVAAVPAA